MFEIDSLLLIDLIPREMITSWLKHLRNQFPTVAIKSSTQVQREKIVSLLHACDFFGEVLTCCGNSAHCLVNDCGCVRLM